MELTHVVHNENFKRVTDDSFTWNQDFETEWKITSIPEIINFNFKFVSTHVLFDWIRYSK